MFPATSDLPAPSFKIGTIVGAVFGVLVLVCLVVTAAIILVFRRHKGDKLIIAQSALQVKYLIYYQCHFTVCHHLYTHPRMRTVN